ncbi:TPA: YigZ family protein [Streptococcus equi subsp. zooepidemicus]|uniref:YigZ family protein n=1 Tax=Streptococcus equi TaxID=1336 RepID=UPI00197D0E12|nr:YigZ family protein [Streptococcus equi]MCD3407996.1 YigZ family protein [Streptococcus equi subsp. zooepidemicus]MDI5901169.1 YigZ family protein [Streptococcus equi subsp. zooepidemicus]MDI5947422.1 YigZ family protein [Streptococcus equi subsp. zooepidemicus]MDI5958834.1 YigZ family protein [Streptococcus equi subsp. zooepidemicus]MDI5960748.1 YigZ family protein [Streptococcus equi subsp. zooepidemicus]
MEDYKTIMTDGLFEESIKKSRFICQIKRVYTEEEARAFIADIKKKHYKANHSCSAMIIGDKGQTKRSNDDGEPSGTAGIPMLSVLERQELTNLVAVVTRYFGGIKLGAGGLIRAYSGVTAAAIQALKVVEVKKQTGLAISLTYPQYQIYPNFLEQEGLIEMNTEFSDVVRTAIYFDPERLDSISKALIEHYHGKVFFEEIESQRIEVPVLPAD